MQKLFILLFSFIVSEVPYAQNSCCNQKVFDTLENKEILIGYCTREGLLSTDFSTYYNDEYSKYKADPEVIKRIIPLLRGVTITIVMGTWCSDSHEQVPRFLKIVDLMGGKKKPVTMICVNTKKQAVSASLEGMNIGKVPTFIFYRKKKEIGRIVETPAETLEKDMFSILNTHR